MGFCFVFGRCCCCWFGKRLADWQGRRVGCLSSGQSACLVVWLVLAASCFFGCSGSSSRSCGICGRWCCCVLSTITITIAARATKGNRQRVPKEASRDSRSDEGQATVDRREGQETEPEHSRQDVRGWIVRNRLIIPRSSTCNSTDLPPIHTRSTRNTRKNNAVTRNHHRSLRTISSTTTNTTTASWRRVAVRFRSNLPRNSNRNNASNAQCLHCLAQRCRKRAVNPSW